MPIELGNQFRSRIVAAESRMRAVAPQEADQEIRPGGWLRKEALGHLIDSALNNHQRFVRASIDGSYQGPSYAQQPWIDIHGYRHLPWSTLLMHWRAQNDLLAHVVDRIPDPQLQSLCEIGGSTRVSLSALIEDYLVHLDHHVDQICQGIAAAPVRKNPYAYQLGNRDAMAVIGETEQELRRLAQALGPAGLARTFRPGGWTAREILRHLADTELAFAFRIRQCLAETDHVIQPFDQDRWNALLAPQPDSAVLDSFGIVRSGNLALLASIPEETFAKRLVHPERGEMTFRDVVETMAGHDLNHRRQLEAILQGSGATRGTAAGSQPGT